MTQVRVVVQERRRLFRDGLALLLDAEPDFRVVLKVATASDLVDACDTTRPDLVVLEADALDWDPARVAAALRKRQRSLRVVGIHGKSLDRVRAGRLRQAGVRGLVTREAGYGAVLSVLAGVVGRHAPTAPTSIDPVRRPDPANGRLTDRQVEILRLVSAGGTTKDISEALGISPKTVENHKQRLFVRLGVQSQAHAVAVAMREGLLSPVVDPGLSARLR